MSGIGAHIGGWVLTGALILYAEPAGQGACRLESKPPVWTAQTAQAFVACVREAADEGYVTADLVLVESLALRLHTHAAQEGLTRMSRALLKEAGCSRAVAPAAAPAVLRRCSPADTIYSTLKKALRKAPPEKRRILQANLRRRRKLPRKLPSRYLWVNPAVGMLYFIDADTLRDSMRVVVGRPNAPTPDLVSRLTAVVTHPAWTVPPVALRDDVLPRIQACRDVIQEENMRIFDANRRRVRNDTVHWDRYGVEGFPFRIVQAPGPRNPLGRLQFVFPNAEGVYLHDTPLRKAFDKTQRTFSSGCVRLEHPDLLLDWLDWSEIQRAAIDSALVGGLTRVFYLRRPLPVMLHYATAMVRQGRVAYLPDVYERDDYLPTKTKGAQ